MLIRSHLEQPIFLHKFKHHAQFKEQCHGHHIAGLLYGFWPEDYSDEFYKSYWKNQWQQNELHKDVLKQLNNNEFNPVLLKGMSIAEKYYPNLGCRFMSDIDLLIPSEQWNAYQKFLTTKGFSLIKKKSWKADRFKAVWEKLIVANWVLTGTITS